MTILLATPRAEAQGGNAERDEARRIAAEAEAAYNTGNFEDALVLYERAYEVFAAPQLQFNLGQCHRELGHHDRVVFFLERYLEELPDAPNRATVQELIDEARATVEQAERAAEEAQRRAAERVEEAHRLEMARQQEELRRQEAETLALQRSGSEVYEEWWFWTLIGVVVAAGVGVTVGMVVWQTPVLPSGSLGTTDVR